MSGSVQWSQTWSSAVRCVFSTHICKIYDFHLTVLSYSLAVLQFMPVLPQKTKKQNKKQTRNTYETVNAKLI